MRLAADIRESAAAQGHAAPDATPLQFSGPCPGPEARAAFADYVRCRWPIRVFALDPVSAEQNVDDAFARRRELQIALATAAATGRLNAQALTRFTRRLEEDMAVVALNKTAVGFAHGADTFGWRFYPRVQTPPARGGLAALGETVCGPTTGGDLARRRLEPGQRECVAIVVMPAFVPCLTLDVRTTWFSLAHPRAVDPGVPQALALSRAVKAVQATAAGCGRCGPRGCDDDLARLLRIADQLERRLPLQTLQARIPQENTSGGFELFNAGVTDLAPELLGWYGAPGIDPAADTTLFLVGKGFSVLDTQVIAGGRPARFTLVSREILKVEVPAGASPLVPAASAGEATVGHRRPGLLLAAAVEPLPAPDGGGCCPVEAGCGLDCNRREVVDIHLATPYGVSGHLLVPVVRRDGGRAGGMPAFDPSCTLGLTFSVTKSAAAGPAAKVDEFFTTTCDAVSIAVPASFIPPPKAALRLLIRDAATGATAATFSFPDPFFDARHGRYLIAGGDLRNFVGDTSRPATDKTLRGAVKPYLDSLLQRAALDADGDAVTLTATATIVAGEHEVPVGGAIGVTATRRGKTTAEPL